MLGERWRSLRTEEWGRMGFVVSWRGSVSVGRRVCVGASVNSAGSASKVAADARRWKQCTKLPNHVAIIPDGNGRWAEKRGWSRQRGHMAGAQSLKKIVDVCSKLEIPNLTVFVCSTENMNRDVQEVSWLMQLVEVRDWKLL